MSTACTPAAVAERLTEAADVLRRLRVTIGPRGIRSSWPDVVQAGWGAGWEMDGHGALRFRETRLRPAAPVGAEIDRMDEALDWLRWIEGEATRKVVWARACGVRWAFLGQQMGRSREWCRLLQQAGLKTICRRLQEGAEGRADIGAR